MKNLRPRGYNHFFANYRAALKGDIPAAKFLLGLAVLLLEENKPLPSGLRRYLVSILNEPARYKAIMTYESRPKLKRGRPSLNSKTRKFDYGIRSRFIPRQYSATEEYAMAMMYLVSLGHPINASTTGAMESATTILSELTGRSDRSMQNDYYAHVESLRQDSYALARGELELKRLRMLNEWKRNSAK